MCFMHPIMTTIIASRMDPLDEARTYHFGGDTKHVWGYLLHPLFAVWALYPVFAKWLKRSVQRRNRL
jgi:hypothetical protein